MLIEKIAQTLGLRPDELRRKNLLKMGQTTATGQILKYSVSALETFEDVLNRSAYDSRYESYRKQNRPILARLEENQYPRSKPEDMLRGIGVSAFQHGAGFTGTGENKIKGKIRVELKPDGRLTIYSASTEMGQGEATIMPTIMARALGINRNQVKLAEVNTDVVPDSGPTVASRTTMIVGSLLVDAANEIINDMSVFLINKYERLLEYQDGCFNSKTKKGITYAHSVAFNPSVVDIRTSTFSPGLKSSRLLLTKIFLSSLPGSSSSLP